MTTKTKTKRTSATKPRKETARLRTKPIANAWPKLSAVVPITTFAPEPFEARRPLSAVIQPIGDEHLATFFDANINASGETQEEAFANLKDILLATFQMLERMPESRLGPGPRRQRAVLNECIRRVT